MASPNTYIQDDTGTYIPATQRPDGSWRKARRVKDGYIPQDEMPLYESKGKQWAKNKPSLPVGLDPSYTIPAVTVKDTVRKIPGLSDASNSQPTVPKSSKKKKKKSDNLKTAVNITNQMAEIQITRQTSTHGAKTAIDATIKTQPVATDPAKRIRNLKKKLQNINALKQRIKSGELKNPEKDQLDKIARQDEIEAEIEELEAEFAAE